MAPETQSNQNGHASEAELAGLRGGLTKEVILLSLIVACSTSDNGTRGLPIQHEA